jgi:hypothetical protein
MILVGIDFSLNSTGAVILKDGKYHWLSFVSNLKPDNKPFIHHKALKEIVEINDYTRNVPKNDYIKEQCYKQTNAYEIALLISQTIAEIADKDEDVVIAFEGFAYGAKGRAFIDMIAYNSFCKMELMKRFDKEIIVFSPSEIKAFHTGKGNCGKDKMFDSFLQSTDPRLEGDPFFNYCKSIEWESGDPPKPLDDIVDAYAITLKLEDHLLRILN